jgi:two-component system, LytTR family, sensor kinase
MKKPVIILLHLAYWGIFCLLLFFITALGIKALTVGQHPQPMNAIFFWWARILFGFAIIPGLIGFYGAYTFLFDRFFIRRRVIALLACSVGLSIIAALTGDVVMSIILGKHILFASGMTSFMEITVVITFGAFMNAVIGIVMRGFVTAYSDIRVKEELGQKNAEMELSLIKAQVNPHFLFNTINNIDVLIEKDAATASSYLNKLSDIMRFMLYETKADFIPLSKELSYIDKYIDLQKIRSTNPHYVNYVVEGDVSLRMIAPMLFIPFIENAFKHAEQSKKKDDAINIRIKVEEKRIIFDCENYNEGRTTPDDSGGLGNVMIRKRLALLYPGRHSLEMINENNIYKVKLILNA